MSDPLVRCIGELSSRTTGSGELNAAKEASDAASQPKESDDGALTKPGLVPSRFVVPSETQSDMERRVQA
eukprot:4075963-Amphidinium_carterae.1